MRIVIVASAMLALGLTASTTLSSAADRNARDLAGVWRAKASVARLMPMDGKALPFTAEGRARYEKISAGLKSGVIVDQAVYLCLPEGMPRAMTSAYPFQIMLTPGQLTFAHEANPFYRIVNLTDKHADPNFWDPSYMGDGIAKWQGDKLVIDSTNFKAERIYLDASGLPVSDQLHLTERIRLIDGGKQLEDLITVTDPVIFAKPWTARRTFERRDDIELKTDWMCGEPHRDVSARPKLPATAASTARMPDRHDSRALTAGQMALNGYWRHPSYAAPGGAIRTGGAAPGTGPMAGVVAKLQPWASAVFAQAKEIEATGEFWYTPTNRCIPAVVPGIGVPYGTHILVEPHQVTFLYELNRTMRLVHIDQKHPAEVAPSWLGHSVGHWEGETLVVDTIGFNDKNVLANGVPMTSRMHIVQRLRMVNGKLEERTTFDDPGALTGIFEKNLLHEKGAPFQEYVCAENNLEGGVPTSTGQYTPPTMPKARASAEKPATR